MNVIKEIEELRNLTVEELEIKLLTLRKEQFHLRMKKANGTLSKTHLIAKIRRSVARVKTVLTNKVGK